MKKIMLRQAISSLLVSVAFVLPVSSQPFEKELMQLSHLITTAQKKGVDVERELMTLNSAKLFLIWAQWDEDNQDKTLPYYQLHPLYKKNAVAEAAALPKFERASVHTMLVQAINELTQVIDGEIIRKPVVLTDYEKVKVNGKDLTQNGQPVFIGAYTWKPDDPILNQYFGNLNSHYISPNLFKNENWAYAQNSFDKYTDSGADLRIGQTFLAQTVPNWAKKKYPEITQGKRIFHGQDIDHPMTRVIYHKLFTTLLPHIKDKRSNGLGYMLFNEPTFITQKDYWNNGMEKVKGMKDKANSATQPVSSYTFAKFRQWLVQEHGNIKNLNALWHTNYQNFDAVTIEMPIDVKKRGSAQWYDWSRFNQSRVNSWFQFLNDEIKAIDTDAKTHIKLMPHLWYEEHRDHGMDFESLLEMGDIIGFDAKAQHSVPSKKPKKWQKDYSFDWQGTMMPFDFFTSVQPNQVLWDSENHFFSNVKFLIKDVDVNYVNSMYWMALTHGLDGSSTWLWTRQANGDFSDKIKSIGVKDRHAKGNIVDINHQPLGLHTLTRTLMEANAHGRDLVQLQHKAKPIRLFYSETSAINKAHYMNSVGGAYRQLYFEGMALGFVTERILTKPKEQWQQVVIRDATHVTEQEFLALQAYLDQGGVVFIDSKSLRFNQYGQERKQSLKASNGELIYYKTLKDLQQLVLTNAEQNNLLPEIEVKEISMPSNGVKSIAWRNVKKENGHYVASITNVGNQPVTFTLRYRDSNKKTQRVDLFTGKKLPVQLTLAPKTMKFIEMSEQ